jgi:hypothetical protein
VKRPNEQPKAISSKTLNQFSKTPIFSKIDHWLN